MEPSLGISPVAAPTFRPLRARGPMGENADGTRLRPGSRSSGDNGVLSRWPNLPTSFACYS